MNQYINIRQYNILSSALSEPDTFKFNDPLDCDPETRYTRLINKLQNEIKNNVPIFTLQEISLEWVNRLLIFFNDHNYIMIYNNYSSYVTDYMGVAICFSRDFYKLENVKMIKPRDIINERMKLKFADYLVQKQKNIQEKQSIFGIFSFNILLNIYNRFFNKTYNTKFNDIEDEYKMWQKASNKYNTLIMVQLQNIHKKSFVVGTYHMPCEFMHPKVMTIHSSIILQQIQEYSNNPNNKLTRLSGAPDSNNLPYILSGDFNFTPTSPQYKWYTLEKALPDDDEAFTKLDKSDYFIHSRVTSVYPKLSELEPLFTCFSKTVYKGKENNEFKNTLDYIFVSDNISVKSVLPLPDYTEYIPNTQEPSDHLMIGAELEI